MADTGHGDRLIVIVKHPKENFQPRVFVIPTPELWAFHRPDLDQSDKLRDFLRRHPNENLDGAAFILADLAEDSGT